MQNTQTLVKDRSEYGKISEYVEKMLSSNKEFVIRLMMMSAAIPSPERARMSLFHALFGNTTDTGYGINTQFRSQEDDFPLRFAVYSLESSHMNTQTIAQPTDNGICAIVNGNPNNVFEKSTLNITLFNVINQVFDLNNLTVMSSKGAGLTSGLALHIVGPRHLATKGQSLQSRRFQVSFNQQFDFFSNMATGFILKPGFQTSVTVTPTMHVTTNDFKNLALDVRKCRYYNELPDTWKLFNGYTQKSCHFLCMIEYLSINGNCTPWDHIPMSPDVTICDGLNAYKFARAAMEYDPNQDEHCQCLPDCESVTFATEISTVSFDDDILCTSTSHADTAGVTFGNVGSFPKIINSRDVLHESMRRRRLYELVKVGDAVSRTGDVHNLFFDQDGFDRHCREHLSKEHAILTVTMRDPNMLQIVKSTKFTFADRLGIAGGTIGLFTGLSLISIVEIAYWIIIWIVENAKKLRFTGKTGVGFGYM